MRLCSVRFISILVTVLSVSTLTGAVISDYLFDLPRINDMMCELCVKKVQLVERIEGHSISEVKSFIRKALIENETVSELFGLDEITPRRLDLAYEFMLKANPPMPILLSSSFYGGCPAYVIELNYKTRYLVRLRGFWSFPGTNMNSRWDQFPARKIMSIRSNDHERHEVTLTWTQDGEMDIAGHENCAYCKEMLLFTLQFTTSLFWRFDTHKINFLKLKGRYIHNNYHNDKYSLADLGYRYYYVWENRYDLKCYYFGSQLQPNKKRPPYRCWMPRRKK